MVNVLMDLCLKNSEWLAAWVTSGGYLSIKRLLRTNLLPYHWLVIQNLGLAMAKF